MKTRIMILLVALFALSGCINTRNVGKKFAEFEKLGVTEIVVTGKFSHTDYTVKKADGKRRAEINHSNLWVPQVRIVRETEDK
jgi:muramoyltetrapeptide carboxypeptidase LdcA involved in peptidoglycan recycling